MTCIVEKPLEARPAGRTGLMMTTLFCHVVRSIKETKLILVGVLCGGRGMRRASEGRVRASTELRPSVCSWGEGWRCSPYLRTINITITLYVSTLKYFGRGRWVSRWGGWVGGWVP